MITKYTMENQTNRQGCYSIKLVNGEADVTIITNDVEENVHLTEDETYLIKSKERIVVEVDTTKAYVETWANRFLEVVDGPIEERKTLDEAFLGCVSLIHISDDVFIRNKHAETLTKTFKDCIMYELKHTEFLRPLENVKTLDNTFCNINIKYLNQDVLGGLQGGFKKIFMETFKNAINLISIAANTFGGILVIGLIRTFENCRFIKTIASEFFSFLDTICEIVELFKNCIGLTPDPNVLSYVKTKNTRDIFSGCNAKINNFQ